MLGAFRPPQANLLLIDYEPRQLRAATASATGYRVDTVPLPPLQRRRLIWAMPDGPNTASCLPEVIVGGAACSYLRMSEAMIITTIQPAIVELASTGLFCRVRDDDAT
jgi:hypothetical protein